MERCEKIVDFSHSKDRSASNDISDSLNREALGTIKKNLYSIDSIDNSGIWIY